jgi:CheY-like chemotaxis protein
MNADDAKAKRVLVADDDPLILRVVRTMLTSEGYKVETVDDGDKALAKYKPDKYSLIITDFLMPNMDGFALAKAVKAISPAQPMMLISGFMDRITDEERNCSNFDFVLRKPFTWGEFHEAVAKVLQVGEG